MAEVVKIKFEVDKSQLDGAISSSKTLEQELKKAGVSAQNMDAAMEGVNDALQEAGVDAKTFAKALDQSATSTKSLKTQLAEAKNEAVRMSQQFGAFSKEAQQAAQKAAKIKDEINDLNDTLDALNPEAKLNAFVKLGQGIQGGFQAATGALQVFGVENERITKLAQQFQGVLNLTQGINSVLQLKDVYGQLRLVLGVTTAAQEGLNVAMAANPAGAVAIAVGALVAAVILLKDNTDEYIISEETLNRIKQDSIKATDDLRDAEDQLAVQRDKNAAFDIQRRKALEKFQQDLSKALFDQTQAQRELTSAEDAYNELKNGASRSLIREREERLKNARELKEQADQTVENIYKELAATKQLIDLREKEAKTVKETSAKKKKEEDDELVRMQSKGIEVKKLIDNMGTGVLNMSSEAFRKMQDLFRLLEANPYEVKAAFEALKEELNGLKPVYADIKKLSSEIPPVTPKKLTDQEKRAIVSDYMNLASEFVNIMQEFNNIETQNRIATQDELLRTGKISEEKYQKEISRIKRQQAEADRDYAIYQILIKTAQSIMTTAGQVGFPAAIPLIAAISALGAAQIVAVQNAPLPKFKKGTLNLGGGNVDADGGQVIVAHRGEAIIPRERNMAYHPAIEAIYNGRISPKDINGFVEYKLSGRIPTSVNATISSRDLRSLRPNDTVNIKNSNVIAKQIAGEIGKLYDPRMR